MRISRVVAGIGAVGGVAIHTPQLFRTMKDFLEYRRNFYERFGSDSVDRILDYGVMALATALYVLPIAAAGAAGGTLIGRIVERLYENKHK